MKTYVGITCVIALLGTTFSKATYGIDPIPTNPKFITNVDGKSFYSNINPKRNWTEAGAYCDSIGMKLASITSKAQTDALQAASSGSFDGFYRMYWTSGRDVQLLRQFSWNSTGEAISDEDINFAPRPDVPYQTCLYYNSHGFREGLENHVCSYKLNTLCEFVQCHCI